MEEFSHDSIRLMKDFDRRTACAIVVAAAVATLIVVASTRTHVAAQSSRSKLVYDAHCVECHGADGRGDGPASARLTPPPLDFTSGKYKIRSTESGSPPTDEDLIRSVRQGLYGSSMPAWDTILSDGDVRAVVDYIKTFSSR